ncbi:helix-turn-helix domain-containing protein [Spiractinospora alimapuensis]|uniref:helix-turn-helix domain-containing protein n=1 Tax=Spiractinospora alimapuensis TaxID=2820884 RepID=UPI001F2B4B65|nr:helix-turn-helix transcriptional regulator [Spiractinospora alimapuensis]QVQ51898.1 helix-turn-helix domain-containing protein [Spiractinospora alimapuensis]
MSDQGPVVQRALLVGELTRLRKDNAFTQAQVAQRLEWSQAKLMRIEGGKQSVRRSDLLALLREYGVDEDETERLLLLSRESNRTGWWDRYRGNVSDAFIRVMGFETGAKTIGNMENQVIPGLLQTRDYAEVISGDAIRGTAERSAHVELRMERQTRVLERDPRPLLTFLVDEAAIWRHIGVTRDSEIMPEQLQHLINLTESGQVDLRVIPFTRGSHEGMFEPFFLLGFEGPLPDLLYREKTASGPTPEFGDVTEEYKERFALLYEKALSPEETIRLLRGAISQMRGNGN